MKSIILTKYEVDEINNKHLFVHLTMDKDEYETVQSDWVTYKHLGTEYLTQMLLDYGFQEIPFDEFYLPED